MLAEISLLLVALAITGVNGSVLSSNQGKIEITDMNVAGEPPHWKQYIKRDTLRLRREVARQRAKYRSNKEMEKVLKKLVKKHPDKAYMYSIGKSVKGRELLLSFAKYLLSRNKRAKKLLQSVRVHLLPSMNPDGFDEATEGECRGTVGRNNANGMDLNRNFPDPLFAYDRTPSPDPIQPETEAVMEWIRSIPFLLSAGIHAGQVLANYPLDGYYVENADEVPYNKISKAPDHDVLLSMAKVYAGKHAFMANGPNCDSEFAPDGTINGAYWYEIIGGMQDYNYLQSGVMEITLELSCCKYPEASTLKQHISDNRKAMITFLEQANQGVRGVIVGANSKKTVLQIKNRDVNFYSDADGEFARILLPGKYKLVLVDYKSIEVPIKVTKHGPSVYEITTDGKIVKSCVPKRGKPCQL